MHVYFAGDHAGFSLKQELISFVEGLGFTTEDCGPFSKENSDDYPDFVIPAAKKLASRPDARAIFIGGSGEGEAMAANRVLGVRAAVYYGGSQEIIKVAREHNDANALSLGARFVNEGEAKKAVALFLEHPFAGGRHVARIAKLDDMPLS